MEQVSGADDSETDDSETDVDDDGLETTCTLLMVGLDHDVSHKTPNIYMNVNQTLCMMHYKKCKGFILHPRSVVFNTISSAGVTGIPPIDRFCQEYIFRCGRAQVSVDTPKR